MYAKLGTRYLNLEEILYIEKTGSGATVYFKNGQTLKIAVVIHDEEFDEITKK